MKFEYFRHILEKYYLPNFMKIRPLGAQMFHAGGRIWRILQPLFAMWSKRPKNKPVRAQKLLKNQHLTKFRLVYIQQKINLHIRDGGGRGVEFLAESAVFYSTIHGSHPFLFSGHHALQCGWIFKLASNNCKAGAVSIYCKTERESYAVPLIILLLSFWLIKYYAINSVKNGIWV